MPTDKDVRNATHAHINSSEKAQIIHNSRGTESTSPCSTTLPPPPRLVTTNTQLLTTSGTPWTNTTTSVNTTAHQVATCVPTAKSSLHHWNNSRSNIATPHNSHLARRPWRGL